MFIHIKEFIINNFNPMVIKMEAKIINSPKVQEINTWVNGVKTPVKAIVLELKPDKHPGKTVTATVLDLTKKFEEDKRYLFEGDFTISKSGFVNYEIESATLLK
jgi:hypothetical protein